MKKLIIWIAVPIAVIAGIFLYFREQQAQTLFHVYTLGRYAHAAALVEQEHLSSLSDLPDVRLVAHSHSLRFDAAKIRQRVFFGYHYDLRRIDDKKFMILASPVQTLFFNREFAILDDLNVRINPGERSSDPYSYEAVKEWPIIPVWYPLQTEGRE